MQKKTVLTRKVRSKKDENNIIFKLRQKHNLSQYEMAEKLGINQSYISKIETAPLRNTRMSVIINLRKKFKININSMIDKGVL